MPPHQRGEGRLVVAGGELLQQLHVRLLLGVRGGGQLADVPQDGAEWWVGHVWGLRYGCVS